MDPQILLVEILEYLNQAEPAEDNVREILLLIQRFAGTQAGAIRLRAGDDFPYFVSSGFPPEFVAAENSLCVPEAAGEGATLACLCGLVLRGRTYPDEPFFTRAGSFWTNASAQFAARPEWQGRIRGRCVRDGYQSVALIPLRSGPEIIGLLQLADQRAGCFNAEMIEFFERVGASIGIALKRKQALDALRKSEEHFRILTTVSPVGIYLTDTEGRCQYVNQRWCEMSGRTPAQALREGWAAGLHPEDRERVVAAWPRMVQAAGKEGMEYRYQTPAGEATWVAAHALALHDASGRVFGYLGTNVDITGRKRAEQERLRMERLALIGELAAGVAHEIRNPLHGTLSCVEMLRNTLGGNPPALELLQLVEQGLERMAGISDRFLRLGRDDGQARAATDVGRLVEDAAALMRVRARDQGVALTAEVEEDLPRAWLDHTRISEALLNLLTNALDASRPGGTVRVRAARRARPAGLLELSVRDNGSGIPPQLRERIFVPFFTTKAVGKGAGLGLALVKKIVESHGGFVEVSSVPARGTTMCLCLPFAPPPPAQEKSV